MSIRRQSKTSWEVRVYAFNPVTGKSERRSFTVKGTYQEARKEEAKLKREAAEGTLATTLKESVEDYSKRWLTQVRPTVRKNTHATYQEQLERWVYPYIGEMSIGAVTGETLNHLYGQLLAEGGARGEGLSAKSVRHVHVLLKSMFRDAVRWGHLGRNPGDAANPPRLETKEKEAWTADDLKTFLAASRDDALMHALYTTVAMTGMRRSEALGLRWSDVDYAGMRINIQQARVPVSGVGETKSKHSRRSIPVDQTTVEAIQALERHVRAERAAVDPTWHLHRSELVFATPDGTPLSPEAVSKRFLHLVRKLGLPEIGLHGLRHTHATLLIEAGVPMKIVSERLGHANISITMDLYTHPSDEAGQLAVDALQRKLA